MTDRDYRGSCLCGAVTFRFATILPRVAHCHCSMCRKFHGASFATIGSVPRADFEWLTGTEDIREYRAGNGTVRSFCGRCGSSLAFYSPRGAQEVIELALGCVDSDVPVEPDAHIFTAFAANWTRITDELPQYMEGRDSSVRQPDNEPPD